MSPKTFARLMLSLPYIITVTPIIYLGINAEPSFITETIFFLSVSALYWFMPYTLLVIYLLEWSRNKTTDEIKVQYTSAPIKLMYFSGGFHLFATLLTLIGNNREATSIFGTVTLLSIASSLIIGYLFVGVALLVYKIFHKFKLIKE